MNDITVQAVKSGRTAYGVVPNPDDPIILQIEGKLSRVLEISANGFSLPGDIVSSGRRLPFHLDLPSGQNSISGYVDALAPGDSGQVQCLFVNLSPDEVEAIHRYVLIRQKEVIRSLRATR